MLDITGIVPVFVIVTLIVIIVSPVGNVSPEAIAGLVASKLVSSTSGATKFTIEQATSLEETVSVTFVSRKVVRAHTWY